MRCARRDDTWGGRGGPGRGRTLRPAWDSLGPRRGARATLDFTIPFDAAQPLVSICVATCDRAELLVSRCLASLQRQTYPNLQMVVVGDHCTDDTEPRLAAIRDDRLVFENLGVRGPYPREGSRAGTSPARTR